MWKKIKPHISGRNVKWYSCCGKQIDSSSKVIYCNFTEMAEQRTPRISSSTEVIIKLAKTDRINFLRTLQSNKNFTMESNQWCA